MPVELLYIEEFHGPSYKIRINLQFESGCRNLWHSFDVVIFDSFGVLDILFWEYLMINLAGTEFKRESTRNLLTSLRGFTQGMAQYNINLKPWSPISVSKFLEMPIDRQDNVEFQFKSYIDLVNIIGDDKIPEKDEITEQKILESCARKLKIVFDPSVYEKLDKQDIVEIYNHDLIQIYRSLNFFNLCSYNLLDLLTNEWYELYERSIQVNHLLFEAGQTLTGRSYDLSSISLRHIPQHIMREKFSDEKLLFEITFKEMYPIYTWQRDFYGYLILLEARKVEKVAEGLSFI